MGQARRTLRSLGLGAVLGFALALGRAPLGFELGSTPAVVNAVVDALSPFGVRHLDMPVRPERIWQATVGKGA